MRKIGAYVHIPFCKQKCYYCDFISYPKMEKYEENYIESVIKEIRNFKIENPKTEFDTIYIGGGTPSYIKAENIKAILNELGTKSAKEITLELNPGTFLEEKIKIYKEAGINRISIGLQSSKDFLLKEIGRIHNFEEFLSTYKALKENGFQNINVDLMIGLPNQTIQDIKETLSKIISLNPTHISVYSLILEEGTKLERLVNDKEFCDLNKIEQLSLPNEETERQMYWYVKNILELNGYNHYEISNFSKKFKESKHNLACWNQQEYKGFGIAAHSYLNKKRFSNTCNLNRYIENCESRNFQANITIHKIQDRQVEQKEFMILGLRKIDGIKIDEFERKFNENPIILFKNELNKLVNEDLLRIDGNKILLTNKGIDLANIVWEEFI